MRPCDAATPPPQVAEVVRVYQHLLASGISPHKIAIAGESGGGSLALLVLQSIAARGLPRMGAAWILSPFVDPGLSHPTTKESAEAMEKRDVFVGSPTSYWLQVADTLRHAGKPDELALDDPRWNALWGPMAGLPPLWITVSSEEWLVGPTDVVVARARAAGASVKYSRQPKLPHAWPIFSGDMPEGREETAAACYWLREQLHGDL